MNKNYTILLFVLLLTAITQHSRAQINKQKIYPQDYNYSSEFGKDMIYEDQILIVSDPDYKGFYYTGCQTGYGIVEVKQFRESSSSMVNVQILYPDSGNQAPNHFGKHIAYKNDILVVSSEGEDLYSSQGVGAIYVYRWLNGRFERIAKDYGGHSRFNTGFGTGGVATNGEYVVAYNSETGLIVSYKVGNDALTRVSQKTVAPGGKLQGVTKNNILVVQNGNKVELLQIQNNSYKTIESSAISLNGNNTLGGKAHVDGYTIAFDAYNVFSSGSKIGFVRLVDFEWENMEIKDMYFPMSLSYNNPSNNQQREINDIYLSGDSSLVVSFKQKEAGFRSRVAFFKGFRLSYHLKDIVESPREYPDVVGDWGASVAGSWEHLIVGDPDDKYYGTGNGNPCGVYDASGSVTFFNIGNNYPQKFDDAKAFRPFIHEKYDGTGTDVAIQGNYALIAQPHSDDVGEGAGAVIMLTRSPYNNEFYFREKMYSIYGDDNESFGSSISLSDKFAAIGARGLNNYSGVVHVYPVQSSSGTTLPNANASLIMSPDRSSYYNFGDVVETDGDYLAVAARGDKTKGTYSGAVYIYKWNGRYWRQIQKIVPPNYGNYQRFGYSIGLKGDNLVIGCPDENNYRGNRAGAAYVYRLTEGLFKYNYRYTPKSYGDYQRFGKSVSVGENHMAISGERTGSYRQGYVQMYKKSNNYWSFVNIKTYQGGNRAGENVKVEGEHFLVAKPGLGQVEHFNTTDTDSDGSFDVAGVSYYPLSLDADEEYVMIGDYSNNGTYFGTAYIWSPAYSNSTARMASSESFEESPEVLGSTSAASLYPNPANGGSVRVQGIDVIRKVLAYSAAGEYLGELNVNYDQVDISRLKAGFYIIHIQSDQETKMLKLNVN